VTSNGAKTAVLLSWSAIDLWLLCVLSKGAANEAADGSMIATACEVALYAVGGLTMLAVVILSVRAPAIFSARQLRERFGAIPVYDGVASKQYRVILDTLVNSHVLPAAPALTGYFSITANVRGVTLWPAGALESSTEIPWVNTSRVELGSVSDGAFTYATISLRFRSVEHNTDIDHSAENGHDPALPLLVIGRGLFGAFAQGKTRLTPIVRELQALRAAAIPG
jgi:hypothetical protein